MIHESLLIFLWIIIPMIGLVALYKVRTNYKIEQLKSQGKIEKAEQTISGSINTFISNAPKQYEQIKSEIATIRAQGLKDHLSEEQIKKLTQRLESEQDMLQYAVKYGSMAKPFIKPFDKIVTNLLGKFTGEH